MERMEKSLPRTMNLGLPRVSLCWVLGSTHIEGVFSFCCLFFPLEALLAKNTLLHLGTHSVVPLLTPAGLFSVPGLMMLPFVELLHSFPLDVLSTQFKAVLLSLCY